ncbi:MAG: hypothetical protein RIB97_22380 [Nitratireductor sp.]
MPDDPKTASEAESKFNDTLKRMLETPPKPHDKAPQPKQNSETTKKQDH